MNLSDGSEGKSCEIVLDAASRMLTTGDGVVEVEVWDREDERRRSW